MKDQITALEKIILKVENRIKEIYEERNLEKLELIDNLAFNSLIDFQSEILDHKAAISFNNTSSQLHTCVRNFYSSEAPMLRKRKSSEAIS